MGDEDLKTGIKELSNKEICVCTYVNPMLVLQNVSIRGVAISHS